ncbi:MAG: sulfatase [Verrucomicrobiota bacterium]
MSPLSFFAHRVTREPEPFLRTIAQTVFLFLLFAAFTARSTELRPNILLILADDLGWADTGCYGNKWFETPNLDGLAAEGIRFEQAYSAAPICSASRAALLTGKTTAELGFEFVTKPEAGFQALSAPLRAPPFTLDLALTETTIAENLAKVGYSTAFFGKWHLNQHYKRYLGWSPTHGPQAQGFQVAEEDFGNHPYSYWKQQEKRTFLEGVDEGEFLEDTLTQRSIRFLERDHENPFFLMVSHFYVHDPNHTQLEWLYNYYWEKIPGNHPRREALAHYGSMVTTLDHHVGELLTALEETGHANETLVVFTSDNGGHPNYAGNAPLRGSKWNLYEGGIRVPMIARWRGVIPEGATSNTPVWSLDLFPTFTEVAGAHLSPGLPGTNMRPVFESPEADFPDSGEPRKMVWHFPYYHPEKGYSDAPAEIGVDDGFTSKTKPHSAIRVGKKKLLHFYEEDRQELYDLSANHLEAERAADGDSPSRVLFDFLEEHGARMPTKNPDYSPDTESP